MIRKIIIGTKDLLAGITYSIKRKYSRYVAMKALKKQVLTSKRNPWVEYIACHTSMNYRDAFEIYNFYCLHIVSTPKTTKGFTDFVMDMAGRGLSAGDIKLCIFIAYREAKREACFVVMRKAAVK